MQSAFISSSTRFPLPFLSVERGEASEGGQKRGGGAKVMVVAPAF